MKKVLMLLLLFLLLSVAAFADTKKYAVGDETNFVFDFNKPDDFKLVKEISFNVSAKNLDKFTSEVPLKYFNHRGYISAIIPHENNFLATIYHNYSELEYDESIYLTKGLVFYTFEQVISYNSEKERIVNYTFYKCTITEIYPNYFIAERSEIED